MKLQTKLCAPLLLAAVGAPLGSTAQAQNDYTLFESGPVRPVAMSPNGNRVFVTNTPDGYLEVFDVSSGTATKEASVPVGLEPVAVAARNDDEVWVVNHVSDSVSIVRFNDGTGTCATSVSISTTECSVDADCTGSGETCKIPPRVVRTLLVGDEPRDIVFAGPGNNRAFITTAHRGQNTPWPDGAFDVPGEELPNGDLLGGRADVWVFDAGNLGTSLTGDALTVVNLFGDKPRALATSADGSKVYAAVFRSGNRTVPISEGVVCNGSGPCNVQGTTYPAGRPAPKLGYCSEDKATQCIDNGDCSGTGPCNARETGIIVGYNEATGDWEDERGTDWSDAVRFELPDLDVFEIDANAPIPNETRAFQSVGTVLFNMIANPANDNLYVTNTQANNRVRFEGKAAYAANPAWEKVAGEPASVRGDLHRAHITVIDPAGNVSPRHLNKHIPYGPGDLPGGFNKNESVATPLQMAVREDGSELFVAAFGSNAVEIYNTQALENDTFAPSDTNQIEIEGASGLALDEDRDRLWVWSRRTSTLYGVDISEKQVVDSEPMFNPEAFLTKRGRQFLYDAKETSSNGEASCSSCHIFGDMDDLSWDLGDPDAAAFDNPNPEADVAIAFRENIFPSFPGLEAFDPLKGPMTTQSLRGMKNAGPMHWRGDRTGGADGGQGGAGGLGGAGDPLDEMAGFLQFNVAFEGLLGREEGELDAADMDAFARFALELTYPPNPIRPLDNSLSPEAAIGQSLYNSAQPTDTVSNCNGCHVLDRDQGFFGTDGKSTFENETMEFKVPHLRNAYQKVGMFGEAPTDFFPAIDGSNMGPQVRGTGFLHDGSVATVFNFLGAGVFSLDGNQRGFLEAFIMEFDSDLAPIVGQQVTLPSNPAQETLDRIDLLIERADVVYYTDPDAGDVYECDLIVKGVIAGRQRGWRYQGLATDMFKSDDESESLWSKTGLLALANTPGQQLTFTCTPPGSGQRMGIDRDRDSFLDANDDRPDKRPPSGCSASDAREASPGQLAALILLTLLGLLAIRRRQRRA